MKLDMGKLKCVQGARHKPFVLAAHTMGGAIDLQCNTYDPKIFLVLEKDFCEVLHADFQSLVRITKESSATSFTGARFLSAKTILIWNERGGSFLYYLGDVNDLKRKACVDLSPRNIVLVSDGSNAIYVDRLDIGPYPLYNTATRIAFSHTSEMSATLLPTPANPVTLKQCFICFSCDTLQQMQIEICPFWASLFGSNMKPSKIPPVSSSDLFLALPTQKSIQV